MGRKFKPRVIVGLSGGVDSAVAALLLLEQGFEVRGLFMKNWEDDDTEVHCSAANDIADAKRVASDLAIPLHFANFARQYKDRVFAHFLDEHQAGRTPNPDVLCNNHVKFQAFPNYARRLGADFIATGHYARRVHGDADSLSLARGLDPNKDQSYFLHGLTQDQLRHSLFPLGGLTKPEVRAIAEEAGLHNFDRPDSTGICFIGERDFKEFLNRYLPIRHGPIIDVEGRTLGTHPGVAYFTLGQRHGLGIGGHAASNGKPWYVAEKRLKENALVVVQGNEQPLLYRDTLAAGNLHWVAGHAPRGQHTLSAKIRYRQADQSCLLVPGRTECEVHFASAQWAITPGQSVVLYSGDICLGGGTIERAWNRHEPGSTAADWQAHG